MGTAAIAPAPSALEFLEAAGARDLFHSQTTLFEHIVGTAATLRAWNVRPEVVTAGLYHSVYGTVNYRRGLVGYDCRSKVRALIGRGAERLAFLFCIKTDESLRAAVALAVTGADATITDWRTGERVAVEKREVARLATIVSANAIEQTGRSMNTFRRDYPFMREAAPLLPPAALAAIDQLAPLLGPDVA